MRPGIHIRAGENVCIQAMTPMHCGAAVASRRTSRIASAVVTTGLGTIRTGIDVRVVERAGDLVRVVAHRAQRVIAVERLAAGDEPDLSVAQDLHPTPFTPRSSARRATTPLRDSFAGPVRRVSNDACARPGGALARGEAIECMHSCARTSRCDRRRPCGHRPGSPGSRGRSHERARPAALRWGAPAVPRRRPSVDREPVDRPLPVGSSWLDDHGREPGLVDGIRDPWGSRAMPAHGLYRAPCLPIASGSIWPEYTWSAGSVVDSSMTRPVIGSRRRAAGRGSPFGGVGPSRTRPWS